MSQTESTENKIKDSLKVFHIPPKDWGLFEWLEAVAVIVLVFYLGGVVLRGLKGCVSGGAKQISSGRS
jgi:hypothetical protein